MESHPYENHRGEGAPPSSQEVIAPSQGPEPGRCQYINGRFHQCRMLAAPSSEFCSHHVRVLGAEELQAEPVISEATAKALLAGIDLFATPAEVTLFLGNLTKQVIRRRVGRRDAVTLTYICQLILNSQGAIIRDKERLQAIEAKKPLQVIWDIPGPDRSSSDDRASSDDARDDDEEDQEAEA